MDEPILAALTRTHCQPAQYDTPHLSVEPLFPSKPQLHTAGVSTTTVTLQRCEFLPTMSSRLFFLMPTLPHYPNRLFAFYVYLRLQQR